MPLGDLNSRKAVLQAIKEYDQLGEEAFLERYGFGPARSYFLVHEGRRYPSKAIAGVAHGYQYRRKGPLTSAEFTGGDATVKAKLESLGFTVTSSHDDEAGAPPSSQRNPPWTRDELILALDLYIRSGRRILSEDHPDVIALSELLNQLPIHKEREAKFRNPNGVAMKLANFRRLDPDGGGGHGLSRGNSQEPKIWNEFADNQKLLHETAEAIAQNANASGETDSDEDLEEEFAEGRILLRAHRTRERSGKAVAQRKKNAGGSANV
jgi:5-methylcytosine-specific restriction enzyme A